MADLPSLQDALARVEATRKLLTTLSRDNPERWKKDYAAARVTLQDQFSQMVAAGDAWLAKGADPAALDRFRDAVAKARAKVAQHQARWPVIVIKSVDPAYRRSVEEVDAVFVEIISLVRTLARNA